MDKWRRKRLEIDRTNKQERVRKLFPVWSKNVLGAGMKGKISGIKTLRWLMERATEISKEKCQKEIPILPLVVNQVTYYMSSTSRTKQKSSFNTVPLLGQGKTTHITDIRISSTGSHTLTEVLSQCKPKFTWQQNHCWTSGCANI